MIIRKARLSDGEWILNIRNSALIRKLSNDTEVISLRDHLLWYNNKLTNTKNIYFISEDTKRTVTWYCRLDYLTEWFYLVSIALLPDVISKWLGSKLLQTSLLWLKKWDRVEAEILDSNSISISFFTKFWFKKIKDNLYQLKINND